MGWRSEFSYQFGAGCALWTLLRSSLLCISNLFFFCRCYCCRRHHHFPVNFQKKASDSVRRPTRRYRRTEFFRLALSFHHFEKRPLKEKRFTRNFLNLNKIRDFLCPGWEFETWERTSLELDHRARFRKKKQVRWKHLGSKQKSVSCQMLETWPVGGPWARVCAFVRQSALNRKTIHRVFGRRQLHKTGWWWRLHVVNLQSIFSALQT